MKRKTAEEILSESFLEIAAQKNANKISVSDIVRNCGYSPATFYRHFRDKYDLIAWIYEERCNKIFARYKDSPRKIAENTAGWVGYCLENKDLMINLITNTVGYDSFVLRMVERHVQILENDIIATSGKDALTEKVHMKVYLYSSGVIRLMCGWLLGKITASQAEFTETVLETIPEQIVRLLTPQK